MKKLGFKAKLAGGFGALLLSVGLMAFVGYNSIQRLSDLTEEINKQMIKKQYSLEIVGSLEHQNGATRGFLLSRVRNC